MKVVKNILYVIFLSLLALVLLFPFFVMLSRSFMTLEEATDIPVRLFPSSLQFTNYVKAMDAKFFTHFGNTFLVIGCNVIFVPLSGFLVAYGFAKIKFAGSNVIFSIGMATLMMPSIVCTIPLYVFYSRLNWLNTLLPLIIPPMFGGGMMNIFLIHQFLRGIPNTYVEAAKLDGANELKIAFGIIAPLALPVITLVAVNTFIGTWNDFTGPLTYISRNASEKWTLAVAIYDRFRRAGGDIVKKAPQVQAALCVIMMIPSMILFAFFQKSLINGVSLSGIKG